MTYTMSLIKTADDLYEKLKREADRLKKDLSGDNLYNFVVTAYHLLEWVQKDPNKTHDPAIIKEVRNNRHFKICRDLANASKHFEITNYKPDVSDATNAKARYGRAEYGASEYGQTEDKIFIETENGRVDCSDLINKLLEVYCKVFTLKTSTSPRCPTQHSTGPAQKTAKVDEFKR